MIDSRIHPAAQREYDSAVEWYRKRSANAADRLVAEVEEAIDTIRRHPESYPYLDETYRFYLLKKFPYYIAYRHSPELVAVVAIRHAAQD
jgi:plasmid stabilization system protein ParE